MKKRMDSGFAWVWLGIIAFLVLFWGSLIGIGYALITYLLTP